MNEKKMKATQELWLSMKWRRRRTAIIISPFFPLQNNNRCSCWRFFCLFIERRAKKWTHRHTSTKR